MTLESVNDSRIRSIVSQPFAAQGSTQDASPSVIQRSCNTTIEDRRLEPILPPGEEDNVQEMQPIQVLQGTHAPP
jgi:hypothetical protein